MSVCLFLGYSTSHKGYKCLSPFGRLCISKDVLFNGCKFPYTSLFSSTSTSPMSSSNYVSSIIPTFSQFGTYILLILLKVFLSVFLYLPVLLPLTPLQPLFLSPTSESLPQDSVPSPHVLVLLPPLYMVHLLLLQTLTLCKHNPNLVLLNFVFTLLLVRYLRIVLPFVANGFSE